MPCHIGELRTTLVEPYGKLRMPPAWHTGNYVSACHAMPRRAGPPGMGGRAVPRLASRAMTRRAAPRWHDRPLSETGILAGSRNQPTPTPRHRTGRAGSGPVTPLLKSPTGTALGCPPTGPSLPWVPLTVCLSVGPFYPYPPLWVPSGYGSPLWVWFSVGSLLGGVPFPSHVMCGVPHGPERLKLQARGGRVPGGGGSL